MLPLFLDLAHLCYMDRRWLNQLDLLIGAQSIGVDTELAAARSATDNVVDSSFYCRQKHCRCPRLWASKPTLLLLDLASVFTRGRRLGAAAAALHIDSRMRCSTCFFLWTVEPFDAPFAAIPCMLSCNSNRLPSPSYCENKLTERARQLDKGAAYNPTQLARSQHLWPIGQIIPNLPVSIEVKSTSSYVPKWWKYGS